MNTTPIEPAVLTFRDDGQPWSPRYDDIYHPHAGAYTQARHVFLQGNGLPDRWQGRDRFVVLETGFGLGNNFLATWQAWRDDPLRCERLIYISVEAHPLTRDDLARVHAASPAPDLAAALQDAWPPLTPNLHLLAFEEDRVHLMLALGDVQAWLPEFVASVDAFYLDGFAPARNPRMWDQRVCKALGRLAAPGATLATWSAASALRAHLTTAGFQVKRSPGIGGKRDITIGRYAPVHVPRRAPARTIARAAVATLSSSAPHAIIIGAGLAGCATAWALAEQGWRSTLIERQERIASEASGNPAGLFHGVVHAQDGVHARFNRAAALMIPDAVRIAIERYGIAGAIDGVLRLDDDESHARVRDALPWPDDYVQSLSASQASAKAGLALRRPAWFYPRGGWVDPAGLARTWLARAGTQVDVRCGFEVHALRRSDDDAWRVLDAHGATIAQAPVVVLANAAAALPLLGRPAWPIETLRGQLSLLPAAACPRPPPRIPIAGAGYALPVQGDGSILFGATSQAGDDDATLRESDHRANLAQLERLLGHAIEADAARMSGRVAWRYSAADRMPVIGAMPDESATGPRLDQPRFVPRLPGLYLHTALGSRGITWSALGARVLAALISGAPVPLEASLIDAIDPARFVSRQRRRATPAETSR